jgi:hypothetical protein
MTTALNAIQVAVYARLNGDATLTAKGPIYDDAPAEAAFPYVVVGEAYEVPYDTFGRQGRTLITTIHLWSRAKGFKEVNGMMDDVLRLLDRYALTPAGMTLVLFAYDYGQVIKDPDGFTRHGILRFKALIEA